MFDHELRELAARVLDACRASKTRLATAESCTGGLIFACLTSVAGSSDVMDRGFVTYTNRSKNQVLEVSDELLMTHGAVSEPVARAMAEGVLLISVAQVSVSVTGIAGPGGGTAEKPVGSVHLAAARVGRETLHESHNFNGDRDAVRRQSVAAALRLVLQILN